MDSASQVHMGAVHELLTSPHELFGSAFREEKLQSPPRIFHLLMASLHHSFLVFFDSFYMIAMFVSFNHGFAELDPSNMARLTPSPANGVMRWAASPSRVRPGFEVQDKSVGSW